MPTRRRRVQASGMPHDDDDDLERLGRLGDRRVADGHEIGIADHDRSDDLERLMDWVASGEPPGEEPAEDRAGAAGPVMPRREGGVTTGRREPRASGTDDLGDGSRRRGCGRATAEELGGEGGAALIREEVEDRSDQQTAATTISTSRQSRTDARSPATRGRRDFEPAACAAACRARPRLRRRRGRKSSASPPD